MKRLAIVLTHPVQYYVPIFQILQQRGRLQIKVFYTWEQARNNQKHDPGFGKTISWDLPLLEGYDFSFVRNVAKNPGSHHFLGINNPSLIREIEEWKPEALLIFGWSFLSHLRLMRYFKGKIPLYFRGDSTLLNESEQPFYRNFLRRMFLKQVYKYIDKAFYVGKSNKQYYLAHGLSENQLIFAPHAIDNKRFSKYIIDKDSTKSTILREEIGISSAEYLIIFVGKFIEVKNPLLLLEGFEKIQREGVHLLFIGNGPLEETLKQRAITIRNVHFLPFLNQKKLPTIYADSDLLVLPSKSETWGLVVNEAMASGLPVIVSDKVGCAADLVLNGKNGFIFESGNLHSLVNCLSLVIKDSNVSSQMGESSRQIIKQYNFEAICTAIENEIGNYELRIKY
jgi:glycosyltransferase involved in cell wall biosynthesis